MGAPQGSLEGMWNFGVFAHNIHSAIASTVLGIKVGEDLVKEVTYANDIFLINQYPPKVTWLWMQFTKLEWLTRLRLK